MSAESYLASLPEVETARLPRGTLFIAKGIIYQVTETGSGGYSKACQWRQNEKTEVALIPGSFPARYLPVVPRGRVLPVYRSRNDLMFDNEPRCFVFPEETFALDAAYLDVALVISPGAYVRKNNDEPSFAVTDGAHIFRLYYYQQTLHGQVTTIITHPRFAQRSYSEGPLYWQLLPGWSTADRGLRQGSNAINITNNTVPNNSTNNTANNTTNNVEKATRPLTTPNAVKTQEASIVRPAANSSIIPEPPSNADDTVPSRRLRAQSGSAF